MRIFLTVGLLVLHLFTSYGSSALAHAAEDLITAIDDNKSDQALQIANYGDIYELSERFNGTTPLIFAIDNKENAIAITLLDRGVALEADSSDSTPLHVAAKLGLEDIVLKIMQRGGNSLVNATDRDYFTPLMRAAGACESGAVDIILQNARYINFSLTNSRGFTVYDLAGYCRSRVIKRSLEMRMRNDQVAIPGNDAKAEESRSSSSGFGFSSRNKKEKDIEEPSYSRKRRNKSNSAW